MKKRISIAGLCLLILVLCLAAACGGGEEETTSATTTTSTATTPTTPAQTSTTASTTPATSTTPAQIPTTSTVTVESLTELLGKWTGLEPVNYDLSVTVTGHPTVTANIWQTRNKTRQEYTMDGVKTIMIYYIDKNIMYTYLPDQNMATKMTLNLGSMPHGTMEGEMGSFLDYAPTRVGTEEINGISCTVISFTADMNDIKMWVWTDTGFPIRMEVTDLQGALTILAYDNIDFSDIPESVFEIPEGVQIIEM